MRDRTRQINNNSFDVSHNNPDSVASQGGAKKRIVVSLWVSWGIHSMHSLMQLVCHSVQLRQPQPASYLGRVLSASLSLCCSHCQHAHFVADCTSFIWAGSSVILPLSFCQLACREASIFISSSPAHCRELFVWPPFVICYFLLVIVWPADLHNNTHTHIHTVTRTPPHTHIQIVACTMQFYAAELTVPPTTSINAFCRYL